jgi:DNA primase
MLSLLSFAHKKYEDLLHSLPAEAAAIKYLQQRGYTTDRMRSWSLGYAPADWKFLTSPLINMGKSSAATEAGLISFSNGQGFDFFRNRITIPIHDHNGVLIGFGGRWVPTGDPAEDKSQAKYFNPKESLIYTKSKVWYGLNLAQKAIRQEGYAYVVEGYMDVQAMHDAEINNTVASCGTEIDDQQVKLLKRYTEHVVICYDGDGPGVKKMMKQIDLFLKHNFKVQVAPMFGGMDPDEFIRNIDLTNAEMVTEGAFCE